MFKSLWRVPLFWVIFSWNIGLVVLAFIAIYKLLFWLLGFWKCKTCNTEFWANTGKLYHPHRGGYLIGPFCESCLERYESRDLYIPLRMKQPTKPESPEPRIGA